MAVCIFCITAAVAVRMVVCGAEETLSFAANLFCELRCRMLALFVTVPKSLLAAPTHLT